MNRTSKNNIFRVFAVAALAFTLSACGGGGGGDSASPGSPSNPIPASATVSGVAAIGAPIVGGSVSLKCASGATASAVTGADGTWQASIKNGDAPCVIRVSGGQADGKPLDAPLHSMIVQPGQANITPLTDLMVGIVTIPLEVKTFGKRATLVRNVSAYAFSLMAAFVIGAVM